MGGVVSVGKDNDELVDNLKEMNYIKLLEVEYVLRVVNRVDYFFEEIKYYVYKDLVWKSGNIYLLVFCIYF